MAQRLEEAPQYFHPSHTDGSLFESLGFEDVLHRWVEYITSEPLETWGPQQNAVVNDQLEAAQHGQTTAAHHQHVTDVGADIRAARQDSTDDAP